MNTRLITEATGDPIVDKAFKMLLERFGEPIGKTIATIGVADDRSGKRTINLPRKRNKTKGRKRLTDACCTACEAGQSCECSQPRV